MRRHTKNQLSSDKLKSLYIPLQKKVVKLLMIYLLTSFSVTTSTAQAIDMANEKNTSLYDHIIDFKPSTQSKDAGGSGGGASHSALIESLNYDSIDPGDTNYFLIPVLGGSAQPTIKDVVDNTPKNKDTPEIQPPSAPLKLPVKKTENEPTITRNTSIVSTPEIPGKHSLFPKASSRLLRISELEGFSREQLKMMRNEIYARHAYIFTTEKMRSYFEGQAWYNPLHRDVSDKLTPIEKANIVLIKQEERQRGE